MQEADTTLVGNRSKPGWIYLIAAGYVSLPVFTMARFIMEADLGGGALRRLLFQPYFLWEVGAAVAGAAAVLIVSRVSFLFFLALSMTTLATKAYDVHQGAYMASWENLIMTSFWVIVGVGFISSALQIPYLNPKVRWWTQDERVKVISRGTLEQGGVVFPIITLDLAAGGAFIKLDERLFPDLHEKEESPEGSEPSVEESDSGSERRKVEPDGGLLMTEEQLEVAANNLYLYPSRLDERVRLRIQPVPCAGNMKAPPVYECDAEIVWTPAAGAQYRFGLGLRFVGRSAAQKRWLKNYLTLLEKIGFQTRTQVQGQDGPLARA